MQQYPFEQLLTNSANWTRWSLIYSIFLS